MPSTFGLIVSYSLHSKQCKILSVEFAIKIFCVSVSTCDEYVRLVSIVSMCALDVIWRRGGTVMRYPQCTVSIGCLVRDTEWNERCFKSSHMMHVSWSLTHSISSTDAINVGRNNVRWRQGQKASLAPPCSKQVFWKQMYCVEESTCDILGSFWRSLQWFGARGNSAPLVTPLTVITIPTALNASFW